MKQHYHCNARTNSHIRQSIQKSKASNQELARRFGVSIQTISKWRNRQETQDRSSRPHTIHYALNNLEREIVRIVRTCTWMPLDDLVEILRSVFPGISRSAVYRTLKTLKISRVPEEKRAKAKKFKEYAPGFVHMDVTYLPKIDGVKYYLFVAIDRATRLMYYKVYRSRSAGSAMDFLEECQRFFPFRITHILTDNGMEFTDRFSQGRKEPTGNHRFDKLCKALKITHRLTEPFTPQTNGMVERANGLIKERTIKVQNYENLKQMRAKAVFRVAKNPLNLR
ncbi:DDE-type integrase/transposase/recombinase [Nitratifractor salsuginis]|uniref:Integrase catalytic region n=1 Tax=Nitratifractor salsuginis (strain DSM 16511 / JCM 12458 / E9I37-1) TaxID=749222 RepID=E6X1J4_NITSE|nr:DDE-type integrase/transposase/recombinase [Nitratifractor salsuginis]ADV45927.1 Integrase catalytic region [Nitratifractor salsuginis DSM 16511]